MPFSIGIGGEEGKKTIITAESSAENFGRKNKLKQKATEDGSVILSLNIERRNAEEE